ncbi:MAG: FecR domain-containing protein [Planctomycetota bacterium]
MDPRIDALVDAYIDSSIGDEQFAELSDWLRAGAENRKAFARKLALHSEIAEWCIERSGGVLATTQAAPEGSETNSWIDELSNLSAQPKPAPPQLAMIASYALRKTLGSNLAYQAYAAAAVLLLGLTLVFMFTGDDTANPTPELTAIPNGLYPEPDRVEPVPTGTIVAMLTAEHDAVWDRRPGDDLYAGQRLTLTQGFAEITTHRGAVAILEAPVTIELLDTNALHLHNGQLVGRCRTPSSKGFVVRTAHADIIDLGTEFGVSVTDGQVAATVFAGTIDVEPATGKAVRLRTHQTARIFVSSEQPEMVVEEQPDPGFARRLPGKELVTAASINDNRFQVRVVPGGVREDAKVHTDRPHEINGVDAEGLPAVLLGGDIVQVPADARAYYSERTESLQIEATFAMPAQVYLLMMETKAPEWLTREYTKTAFRVGFDQGRYLQYHKLKLGVGPGQSIDSVMEVWRRKQPAVGRVVVGQQMPKSVSYTLIAVPAERSDD